MAVLTETGSLDVVRNWETVDGERWEKIKCTADSGAFKSVSPKAVAEEYELEVTEEAKAGACFTAANGTAIKYYGNRRVQGKSKEGVNINMGFAVAYVNKTLAAVGSMCDGGNTVNFDSKGGEIRNIRTGRKIYMKRENGVYTFDLWVKKRDF